MERERICDRHQRVDSQGGHRPSQRGSCTCGQGWWLACSVDRTGQQAARPLASHPARPPPRLRKTDCEKERAPPPHGLLGPKWGVKRTALCSPQMGKASAQDEAVFPNNALGKRKRNN